MRVFEASEAIGIIFFQEGKKKKKSVVQTLFYLFFGDSNQNDILSKDIESQYIRVNL